METGERGGYGSGVAGREGGEESVFVSRSEVDVVLKGLSFPASKGEVLETAEYNCASQKVMDVLERLPDRDFTRVSDVESAVERLQ